MCRRRYQACSKSSNINKIERNLLVTFTLSVVVSFSYLCKRIDELVTGVKVRSLALIYINVYLSLSLSLSLSIYIYIYMKMKVCGSTNCSTRSC